MATRAKVCPAPGCGAEIERSMFACRAHWYSIPKELRDRLWAAYRGGVFTPEYWDAYEACESFLEGADDE